MNNEDILPLSLDFDGKHYEGTVEPSAEKGPGGRSVFFRVTLDGELFAYLCCGDKGWSERGGPNQSASEGLITAIGNYIFEHYE